MNSSFFWASQDTLLNFLIKWHSSLLSSSFWTNLIKCSACRVVLCRFVAEQKWFTKLQPQQQVLFVQAVFICVAVQMGVQHYRLLGDVLILQWYWNLSFDSSFFGTNCYEVGQNFAECWQKCPIVIHNNLFWFFCYSCMCTHKWTKVHCGFYIHSNRIKILVFAKYFL